MDPAKLTASLTELVKKFVISFCEVNVGYNDRLDVFGSIHIRSDDSDVVAFVLNEHCYKKSSSDNSDDDDESGPPSKRKSKSLIEDINIKIETQNDSYSNHIKQETITADATNIIDVYSDGEEATEMMQDHQGNNGDVDQNFIEHLLEANNRINQNLDAKTREVTKRGRPRRKQSDMLYEQSDFKTELEFNNSEGFADMDYVPTATGEGEEFKYRSKFNESHLPSSQRKPRKRSSTLTSNNPAMNSLQGSYFQFESTYTCTACGCRFKSMDGLKCHVNSKHLQQKLYSCQFCSQTFLTRQASYSHRVKFHNISRPKAASSLGESDFS